MSLLPPEPRLHTRSVCDAVRLIRLIKLNRQMGSRNTDERHDLLKRSATDMRFCAKPRGGLKLQARMPRALPLLQLGRLPLRTDRPAQTKRLAADVASSASGPGLRPARRRALGSECPIQAGPVANFVSRLRNERVGVVFRLGSLREVRSRPGPFTAFSKLCDRPPRNGSRRKGWSCLAREAPGCRKSIEAFGTSALRIEPSGACQCGFGRGLTIRSFGRSPLSLTLRRPRRFRRQCPLELSDLLGTGPGMGLKHRQNR